VIAELEAFRRACWADMVFIVDDNFIGNRSACGSASALIEWRERARPTMGFLTRPR
jgi:hypothetical protein